LKKIFYFSVVKCPGILLHYYYTISEAICQVLFLFYFFNNHAVCIMGRTLTL
jgi:hypothetical protein